METISLMHETSSLGEARAFCRRLARSHYENFLVASVFLPAELRQHFYNIYAYCRFSDDLGDETGDPRLALELLHKWEQELWSCYQGRPRHSVFVALSDTIETFDIPMEPFSDLLQAFKLDQIKSRYRTYEELLDYCRYSANPVGRLVLYLGKYRDAERQELADKTCTALQLANHWQDVQGDLAQRNRIYLPSEDMERFGYTESDLKAQICDRRFMNLMQLEVERARSLFQEGFRLRDIVSPRLALDIELFGRCGLEVLRLIERVGYDVFRRRPTVSKWNGLKLLARCWLSNRFAG
jgi:squalene synthase HpnC